MNLVVHSPTFPTGSRKASHYQSPSRQAVPHDPAKKNPQDVTCFTGNPGRPALKTKMARKTRQTPLDASADTRADNALIIAGIGAAVLALIYLILI